MRTRLSPLVVGVLSIAAALEHPVAAQPAEAPRGIYCSCAPTSSQSNSVLPSVATLPFVQGILVRVGWDAIEPLPGVYDFSLIDGQLALANQYGVKVALGVVQGSHTPAWLPTQGAQMIDYVFAGQPRSVAAPWDPIYLAAWQNFVAALGANYANDTTISIVHMTHATHNGFEMQLAVSSEAIYVAAGYSPPLYVQSWKAVLDAFGNAFPNHPLDVDVHPVFGSDTVAQEVVAYGKGALGQRFGVLAAWWTEHNANDVYPGMFDEIQGVFPQGYSTIQVAQNFTNNPGAFGPNGLRGTLDLALQSGVRYAEVWNADLLNPALSSDLAEINGLFLCDGHYFAYGDPCVGGSGSAPQIAVTGCPSAGASFGVEITNGAPGATAVMLFGSDQGSTPFPGGCQLLVTPVLPLLLSGQVGASGPSTGMISWSGTLPASATTGSFTLQVLIADAGAPGGVAATRGVYVTLP